MFSSVRWPFQCLSKIRFIGGGGGSQLGVPKARAAGGGGSRGMLPRKILKYRVFEIAFSAF